MPPLLSPFCSQSCKSIHVKKTQVEGMQPNQKARWAVTSTSEQLESQAAGQSTGTQAPTFLLCGVQAPESEPGPRDLPRAFLCEMKCKGLPFSHTATQGGIPRSSLQILGAPTDLREQRWTVFCSLLQERAGRLSVPGGGGGGWGKGSNMGAVINKRSSPHDFLYLVPVASLQAP